MSSYHQLDVFHVPKKTKRADRNFACPECGYNLPIDPVTECSYCGAHLRLFVRVEAPGVTGDDSP